MINALVTGIGGPTAQGIIHGLRKESDIYIVGVDRREINSGRPFCDAFYRIPPASEEEEYKRKIKKIAEEEKIDIIFPSLHEEIILYHHFRSEITAVTASPESGILPILTDKIKTYQYLEQTSVKEYVPEYYSFTSSEELKQLIDSHFEGEKYIVAKKAAAHGSLGFALLTDRKTYLEKLSEGKKAYVPVEDYCAIPHQGGEMIMEYLTGQEYSVDVYMYEGEVVTAVPRERSGVSSGLVLDGKVLYLPELIAAASETAEKLIHTGFINLQFMEKGNSYKLTDVNPRFCGSQVMSIGAGVNFPWLIIQYQLLHQKVEVLPRWGTRMLRYRDQFFLTEKP